MYDSRDMKPESEFNDFEPHLKSAKKRFQLSAGLNLKHKMIRFFVKFDKSKRPNIWVNFYMMIFLKIPTLFIIYYYSLVERLLELKTCLKENEEWVESINFLGIQSKKKSVSEFNEFKPRLKSPKNRFQLSAGLNLEKFYTILSGTNHIWAAQIL